MEHESDGDTNCNWYAWYSHQRFGTSTGGLGNKRTSGNHPNYSIVEIGQNIKKSPGDLRKLAVIQVKNSQKSKIIIQVLRIIGSRHHQRNREERKISREYCRLTGILPETKALQQESHQRNKLLGYPPNEVLETIPKIDDGDTQSYRPKDKNVDDEAQVITSERWHRQTLCVRKRRRKKTW